jgi:hypothetical protein
LEQDVAVSDPDQPAKNPVDEAVEHALDVFVYAPIGLLFEGASLLPQLVEKGKSQVTMARMIGQFAVTQGRGEGEKLAGKLQEQAVELLGRFGGSTAPPPPVVPKAVVTPAAPAAPVVPSPSPAEAADQAAGADIEPATLAIPDYDGLSASHVVNRLAGLSQDELEAVRLYEVANRGRKTILSKVAQLQAG